MSAPAMMGHLLRGEFIPFAAASEGVGLEDAPFIDARFAAAAAHGAPSGFDAVEPDLAAALLADPAAPSRDLATLRAKVLLTFAIAREHGLSLEDL